MLRLHLTCFCGDPTLAVFAEVAELLFHGFRRAGAQVEWEPRSMRRGALNLVIAAHRMPPALLPRLLDERVILNLEQVCAPEAWQRTDAATYRALLQGSPVIDYSERNREWLLRELQVHAEIMTLGHVPELERIPRAREQDIDVLFYGKITPARAERLGALRRDGLRVVALSGAPWDYGKERDALIARSRVVLNLHAHDAHIFEQVRVNYLLINGKAVVSEILDDTEIPELYRRLVDPVCGIDAIVEHCRQLVGDEHLRREREEAARDGMRTHPQTALLAGIACLQAALPDRGNRAAPLAPGACRGRP
ncbi:MAG TPA: hypothetical protein VLU54_14240 [Casimicrobiaceae bacterium]|nr:hypothetical protein [Casimicrobiaceae bacterium]